MREDECGNIVAETWNDIEGCDVKSKINACAGRLRTWSGTRSYDFMKEIATRREQIRSLTSMPTTEGTLGEIKKIDVEIDELEYREETYWAQRSRQNWLRDGDKNTAFFHKKAEDRRRRNTIKGVFDEGGSWRTDEGEAEAVFVAYFKSLFESNNNIEMLPVIDKVQPKVSQEMNQRLEEMYTEEEVVIALKQMHPTKAPGPDGMPVLFYKKYWPIVGKEVTSYVLNILNNGAPIEQINHTHVVLIPKKKVCQSTKDYRPISLCNVLYKLVSKVISNRLKLVLPKVISESQSAFVRGSLITDNVLVAYEMFHYLRKKKKGAKGFMVMKLYMSKAYDRVEWAFIRSMMLKLGFGGGVVELIMRCISSVSYSILFNGFPSQMFLPGRGLRQGDPMSPFLFLICAEGFTALLRDAESRKLINGVKIGRHVPPISHLFFCR